MDGMLRFPNSPAPQLGGPPGVSGSATGYPWSDGEILYAADLNAAFQMHIPITGTTMGGPLHMATYLFDNASADGNDTAVIVPEWTPCYPVANSPYPGNSTGNAVTAQMVVQAQTRQDAAHHEWTAVFGNYVNTGAPDGQKVSIYSGVVQGPLGGTAWALNTDIVRNGVPGPTSNVPGGPSGIGSATPGTPGAMAVGQGTIGYELDYSNWDQDWGPGGAFTVGMYVHAQSIFASLAAIYMDAMPLATPANYGWHNGIFFQGPHLIQDNAILDASNASYSHQAVGSRPTGVTFYANDTAQWAFAVGGSHSSGDILVVDNGPTVLQVGGTHNHVIDITGATITGVAWNGALSVSGDTTALQFIGTQTGGGASAAFVAQANGNATYMWYDTSGAPDAKKYDALAASGSLYFRLMSDNESIVTDWLSVARSGATPTTIVMTATNINLSGTVTPSSLAIGHAGGPTIRAGAGAPSDAQPAGSLWLRTDGAPGPRLYVSASVGTWAASEGISS